MYQKWLKVTLKGKSENKQKKKNLFEYHDEVSLCSFFIDIESLCVCVYYYCTHTDVHR